MCVSRRKELVTVRLVSKLTSALAVYTSAIVASQVMSQEIQEQLHKQQEVIADKQMSVKEDLDKVEPAVIEAQNGM